VIITYAPHSGIQHKGYCQMHIVKLLAALGALSYSAVVNAQAHFECGSAACGSGVTPWDIATAYAGNPVSPPQVYTAIDDLNVRGEVFDVSFSTTAPTSSPFVLSSSAAAPGQPLTGVDAGNAIGAFYASLQPPYGGPGGYGIAGDPGPAFITAFKPAGALSAEYYGATELWDVGETFVGAPYERTLVFGNNGFSANGGPGIISNNGNEVYYTSWTPVAAPEMDPLSAMSAMTLLFGGLLVLRGRTHR
jgi:hypothetical protein